MRTSNYSDYLQHVTALIGIDQGDLQTTETVFLNTFFNKALRDIWERGNWTDLTPKGEVRFPTNLITYPNDLTQSAYWSSLVNVAAAAQAMNNPLDNRLTASSLFETSATGFHHINQSVSLLPNVPYTVSGYARPAPRTNLFISVADSVCTYSAFYNFAQPTPTVGTVAVTGGGTLPVANITQLGNGYCMWSLTLTTIASATPGIGTLFIYLSPDGSTLNYAGTAGSGMYLWGNTVSQTQNIVPASYVIPWEQTGESSFDVVYEVWTSDPGAPQVPHRTNFMLTPNGVELIGPTSVGYYYLSYRYRRETFTGSTYSALSAYASGTKVYYTSAATGNSNYYKSTAATTPGQNPDTNPTLWSVLAIPYVFFEYIVYSSYADWLLTEGQAAKAQAMQQTAQMYLDNEFDRLERQQGDIQPWKVYTHLTSQNRGMGYVGQNLIPAGSANIN